MPMTSYIVGIVTGVFDIVLSILLSIYVKYDLENLNSLIPEYQNGHRIATTIIALLLVLNVLASLQYILYPSKYENLLVLWLIILNFKLVIVICCVVAHYHPQNKLIGPYFGRVYMPSFI